MSFALESRGFSKKRSRVEMPEALEAKNFDMTTFVSILLLTAAGLVAIYSATFAADSVNLAKRFNQQFYFAIAGIIVMMVVAFLPVRWLSAIAWPFYALGIVALVYVILFGTEVYGQKNWITFGSFQFQPSELAKLATIMAVAKYLNGDRDLTRIGTLVFTMGLILLPTALILLEPDPGTSVIFLGVTMVILLWSGVDLFLLFSVVAPAITAVVSLFGRTPMMLGVFISGLLMFFVFRKNVVTTAVAFAIVIGAAFSTNMVYDSLKPYQKTRIQVLLDPELDPLGAGYNVIQTRMAIGSGGLTGKGYLEGTQTQLRYVPKQWTDFIISVPAEEFGFIGSIAIVLIYAFVIFRGVAIASSVRSKYSSVLAIGITGIWFLHITINIGMTLGLLPVVGIPLPFMSYGGTALMTNLLMGGILMNLYRNRRILF
jgi:rod shape determining protein RodA